MTEEQLKRLPQRAQQEIANLRMRLAEAEARCKVFSGEQKTRVRLRRGLDDIQYVPDNYKVEFNFGEDEKITVRLDSKNNSVCIASISQRILVLPEASNSINVKLEK